MHYPVIEHTWHKSFHIPNTSKDILAWLNTDEKWMENSKDIGRVGIPVMVIAVTKVSWCLEDYFW